MSHYSRWYKLDLSGIFGPWTSMQTHFWLCDPPLHHKHISSWRIDHASLVKPFTVAKRIVASEPLQNRKYEAPSAQYLNLPYHQLTNDTTWCLSPTHGTSQFSSRGTPGNAIHTFWKRHLSDHRKSLWSSGVVPTSPTSLTLGPQRCTIERPTWGSDKFWDDWSAGWFLTPLGSLTGPMLWFFDPDPEEKWMQIVVVCVKIERFAWAVCSFRLKWVRNGFASRLNSNLSSTLKYLAKLREHIDMISPYKPKRNSLEVAINSSKGTRWGPLSLLQSQSWQALRNCCRCQIISPGWRNWRQQLPLAWYIGQVLRTFADHLFYLRHVGFDAPWTDRDKSLQTILLLI